MMELRGFFRILELYNQHFQKYYNNILLKMTFFHYSGKNIPETINKIILQLVLAFPAF